MNKGLPNSGVICYFNTMLQCFASLNALHNVPSRSLTHQKFAMLMQDKATNFDVFDSFRHDTKKAWAGQNDTNEAMIDFINLGLADLFRTRFRVATACECGRVVHSVDENVIYIGFPELRTETEVDYKCECGSTRAVQTRRLTLMNNVMVVVFDKGHAQAPEHFTIANRNYALRALADHLGGPYGGHYFARANGRCYNDSVLSNCDMSATANTYVAFYELV